MTRLTYCVPPVNCDGDPIDKSFVELPRATEVALLVKDGQMVPGIILAPDMAVALTWKEAMDLHIVLGKWLTYAKWWTDGRKAETFPGPIVGSEELVE